MERATIGRSLVSESDAARVTGWLPTLPRQLVSIVLGRPTDATLRLSGSARQANLG